MQFRSPANWQAGFRHTRRIRRQGLVSVNECDREGFGLLLKKGTWKTSFVTPRKTLAERIANSTCRICSKPGHWKRECPQRFQKPAEITTMAETPYEPEQDP